MRFPARLLPICILLVTSQLFYANPGMLPITSPGPVDGIYLVISIHEANPGNPASTDAVVVPFSHRFLDENTEGQPAYLLLDATQFVPLEMMERPLKLRDTEGKHKLVLSLVPGSRSRLESLTREHLGERIAVVVDGEAVTMHKVKAVIDSGKVQITRCTDNACEYLYGTLEENIRK